MVMSRGLSRGAGVSECTMGQFTLESSHWRLARSHSGSFTVTLATASGQAGPGTRTGQTPSSQGHWPATGLAGLSLHWLLLTQHWPWLHWLPAPGTNHTQPGEVVVFCKTIIRKWELNSWESWKHKFWKWVIGTRYMIRGYLVVYRLQITWFEGLNWGLWSNSHLFDYISLFHT